MVGSRDGSVLSMISTEGVVPDAADDVVVVVVEADDEGVGVAGGSIKRLCSRMHGGSSFKPKSLKI